MAEKESDIIKVILEYLAYNNIFSWRNNTGAFPIETGAGKRRYFRAGIPGMSDILGVLPDGRILAIEVKTVKGRVSPLQNAFITVINRYGGLAFVARSIEDVEAEFRAWGYLKK